MTFSIVARDQHGRIGMAVSSSSPAVAARCTHLRDGIGAVSSQNITDPRLGTHILDLLEAGHGADSAIQAALENYADADYRQLVVLDAHGGVAVHHGKHTLGVHGSGQGTHSVAAGNMLSGSHIPQAMCDAFEQSEGELEERLLAGLQAALSAGGEEGPVHSAGMAVVSGHGWRDTDLRVDWHEDPIAELGRLLGVWSPQRNDYVVRGLDPSASVGYGVPGDER
ncbi:DUF1028 domain-containing protein [Paeniglutamicibacter psychrophenolicus]|uniref:DUF1028 domain-containing protein n=1 Tax=Paeniglutamicibacter psychrophenolicus TaxID=257454 RepID=UPI00277F13AA|nr:DUF1028 domain-containing protein [Paeniglutamicibacter psychrophenolicus]MDQ0092987.1 putative Ntn-hydrolase superfamily protein [Paeniglutamicibacter psychrophenolicus]